MEVASAAGERRVLPAEAVREILTRQVDADLSLWEFSRECYGPGVKPPDERIQ